MAGTPLLANMNISPQTVKALRECGWDIVRVSELLPANAADSEILELARLQGRIVVTQDLDFSAILTLGAKSRPSLVTLRLALSDPGTVTRRLLEVLPGLQEALREGCAATVDDHTVRVRRLPIT